MLERGLLRKHPVLICERSRTPYGPDRQRGRKWREKGKECKMYVIETDNTRYLYGPFKTADAAAKWAVKNLSCAWAIVRLKEP